MAIYSQLIEMNQLVEQLSKEYNSSSPYDLENKENLSWYEVLRRVRFGPDWKTHPLYLKEQEIIGGIDQIYFEIAKELIKNKPSWIKRD